MSAISRASVVLALLWVSIPAAPESGGIHLNLSAYSTGQSEFGFFNFDAPLGPPLPDGFYAKGKAYNFMFLHGERGAPQTASFEALFPGILIFGLFFAEKPEGVGLFWYPLALANGEIGFRKGLFSLGIVNGFHPFFTRRPYHDAGVRLGFGREIDFGISVYEQDRMRLSDINYGVRADIQLYFLQ